MPTLGDDACRDDPRDVCANAASARRRRPRTPRRRSRSYVTRFWLAVFPRVRRELRAVAATRASRSLTRACARRRSRRCDEELHERGGRGRVRDARAAAPDASALVRLLVAFQVMYDYLDTLGEQPVADPLAQRPPAAPRADRRTRSRRAARRLLPLHPRRDDGGYLATLVATCRAASPPPRRRTVLPIASVQLRAAARAELHARRDPGPDVRSREPGHAPGPRLGLPMVGSRGWGDLSVGVEALLAAAADPCTTYLDGSTSTPPTSRRCARSARCSTVSSTTRATLPPATTTRTASTLACTGNRAARDNLRATLRPACVATPLRRHAAILAGIAGYYLSAEGADEPRGACGRQSRSSTGSARWCR